MAVRYDVLTVQLAGTETAAQPNRTNIPAGRIISLTVYPLTTTVSIHVRTNRQSSFLELPLGRTASFGDDAIGRFLAEMNVDIHAASAVVVYLIIGSEV